jgi:hypothetical protein
MTQCGSQIRHLGRLLSLAREITFENDTSNASELFATISKRNFTRSRATSWPHNASAQRILLRSIGFASPLAAPKSIDTASAHSGRTQTGGDEMLGLKYFATDVPIPTGETRPRSKATISDR